MKILHVNKLYSPFIGGVENAVQNMAEGINQRAGTCEVLVCQDRGPSVVEVVNNVTVTRVASLRMLMSMPISTGFVRHLDSVVENYDIVHVHMPFPLALFCNWRRVSSGGTKIVVHFHSDVVRQIHRCVLSTMKPFQHRLFQSCDVILVGSERLLNLSPTLKAYKHKCKVLPYPVCVNNEQLPLSPGKRKELRERYRLLEGEQVVLFAGRHVYYKGLSYLLKAMREVDAKLIIAGDGPLTKSLISTSRNLGMADRVVFAGRITDRELQELYSISDLFVLPSTHATEAFGLVQVEAMSHGLPVINTDLPTGVPTVSLDGLTGLTVPPRDSARLAIAIRALLRDDGMRSEMSRNARLRAREFAKENVVTNLFSIYEELMPATARL